MGNIHICSCLERTAAVTIECLESERRAFLWNKIQCQCLQLFLNKGINLFHALIRMFWFFFLHTVSSYHNKSVIISNKLKCRISCVNAVTEKNTKKKKSANTEIQKSYTTKKNQTSKRKMQKNIKEVCMRRGKGKQKLSHH